MEEKNGTDEPICRTGIDTDIENRIVETVEEEVDGTDRELKHVYYHMQNRQLMESCCMTQEARSHAPRQPRWGEGERKVEEGGNICVLMADAHCRVAESNTTL